MTACKLWILRPAEGLAKGDDPWDPWYDKAFGFIVEAESEEQARGIAQLNAGDEKRGRQSMGRGSKTLEPWLDAKYSTCSELVPSGAPGVVMIDFALA